MVQIEEGQKWRHPSGAVHTVVGRDHLDTCTMEGSDGTRWITSARHILAHWSRVQEADEQPVPAPTSWSQMRAALPAADEAAIDKALNNVQAAIENRAEPKKVFTPPPYILRMIDDLERNPPKPRVTGLAVTGAYGKLAAVLNRAHAQASTGKGKERHARGETPFEEQPMATINRQLGSVHGFIYQAHKKSLEAMRLPDGRAQAELLGAINYLAGAVIALDSWAKKEAK